MDEVARLKAGIIKALNAVLPIEDLLMPIEEAYHGKEPWANNHEDDPDDGDLVQAIGRSVNTAAYLYALLSEDERKAWEESYVDPLARRLCVKEGA